MTPCDLIRRAAHTHCQALAELYGDLHAWWAATAKWLDPYAEEDVQ